MIRVTDTKINTVILTSKVKKNFKMIISYY